jgi:membrane-associated phospholipid phosphatase
MKVQSFIILVILCFTENLSSQSIDLKILKSINQKEMPCWDKTMRSTSFSVYPVMPATVIGIWSQGYFTNNKVIMRNAYKSAISIAIAITSTSALKFAINRTRPYNKYPNDIIKRDNAGPYSFPSGHTTAAFATATAMSLSYNKWYITIPSFAYAGFVGYSRMRLGMHYSTDVFGGIIIGVGSGLITWKIDKLLNKK